MSHDPKSAIDTLKPRPEVLSSGFRLGRRIWAATGAKRTTRVLIFGAGESGERLARDLQNRVSDGSVAVGFVDDDQSKVGQRVAGVPVLGTRAELPTIIAERAVHEVIIATPSASPWVRADLLATATHHRVRLKTLPTLRDRTGAETGIGSIRNLSLEDVCTRAPIRLGQWPVRKLIKGRRVLVSGAAGRIGSELSRQILALAPAHLSLLDRDENGLDSLMTGLQTHAGGVSLEAVIGDVTNTARIDAVISKRRPELIFHAAAHKDVLLMECHPCEAVTNNVTGARILAEAAELYGVDRFIFVSTDKAVRPGSIMGASKRAGELLVQTMAGTSKTMFVTVRFGEVLDSRGGVVSRLLEQIDAGGPVIVTAAQVQRSFMRASDAIELLLHATAESTTTGTYAIEMDAPVPLVDMARTLIRLRGRVPDTGVPISAVDLRPGEKRCEEVIWPDERREPTPVPGVTRVESAQAADPEYVRSQVRELERLARCQDDSAVREFLLSMIPFSSQSETLDVTAPVSRLTARIDREDELPDGQRCPACASQRLHRSLARSRWERVRKLFTDQRLFRCHRCGWRGWANVMELAGIQEFPATTAQDFALPELPRGPAGPDDDADIRVTDKVVN